MAARSLVGSPQGRLSRATRNLLRWVTDRLPGRVIKGPDGAPFLERYHLASVPWIGVDVMIHRFVASDPDRGLHDHPWRWAVALLLAGSYDELLVPRVDAPRAERSRRRLGPLGVNWIRPHRFHRVLLEPGAEAWTLFVTGPRVKVWGFLAHPDAHRYDEGSSTQGDHYDRAGVARRVESKGDAFADEAADVSFSAETLQYRPFTHDVRSPDPDWWRRAPTGAELRRSAAPLLEADEWLLLLSGKSGAGKDFVAAALAHALGERIRLVRIGEATKAEYAKRTGVSLERLLHDRDFKEQHRIGLTALYDALRKENQSFELVRAAAVLRAGARTPEREPMSVPRIACVVDLRMRYELDYFRTHVPRERVLHVRIDRARAEPEGVEHPTETGLDGVAPDLVFTNEREGAEATATALLGALLPVLARRTPGGEWSDVRAFLDTSLSHDGEYPCDVLGRTFTVHPQVMSPRYSYSPTFLIRHWDAAALRGATVLDMGCGSGVLSVFAALAGANVVAVDINPHAVRLTRENAAAHGVGAKVEAIESDGYAALAGRSFDLVLFNAPYFDHPFDPAVPLTRGVFDPGHAFLRGVLAETPRFLKPGGRLLLVLGSTGLAGAPRDEGISSQLAPMRIVDERSEVRGHRRTVYTLAPPAP